MNQAERLNWQKRVGFLGKKWQDYKAKFPDRVPLQATIRRWTKECNEMLERSFNVPRNP